MEYGYIIGFFLLALLIFGVGFGAGREYGGIEARKECQQEIVSLKHGAEWLNKERNNALNDNAALRNKNEALVARVDEWKAWVSLIPLNNDRI